MSAQPTPLSEAQIHAEQMAFAERTVRSAQVWHNAGGDGPRSTACPQQYYVDLMERTPVVFDAQADMYQLLKMEDVLFVNRHPDTRQSSKYLGSTRPAIPLGLDGDEHRKYRKLLDPVFAPKQVEPLGAQIRELANELIDGFVDAGQADGYRAWAEPLPSTIFLTILGLPTDQLSDFLRFKNLILGNEELRSIPPEEQVERRLEAITWIQQYFNTALDEREAAGDPGGDLIGLLLTTEVDGQRLSRLEILDILGLLVIAGLDTVAASLACFLSYLARHPDQRARLVADPSGWPAAIEELMRFESPVTDGGRILTSEITVPSGATLPAGTFVGISWAAANVDPDVFPSPLDVDFERTPNRHIGFASGFHRCLGSHLARIEMVVAMQVWHERIPNYEIAPGAELLYSGNPRAPHRLPLVW
jgi:cytochrome P450